MCTPLWTGPAASVPRSVLDLRNVIYKFTSPSGKAYVGQTIWLEQRYKQYLGIKEDSLGTAIFKAVKKYGFENFELSVLGVYASKTLLDRAEILAIWKEGTLAPRGYNLDAGGGNAVPTAETRAKMSDHARNRSAEIRKNMSDGGKRRWEKMTAEEREEYIRKLSVPREEARKRRAGIPIPLEMRLKQKAASTRIQCDVDMPLYVSLLRRKMVRGDILVVRVQKPGHRVKTFGSAEFTLSERIKHATAYLETLS